ncbi:hypothetical protein [Amycolatopsis sp. cmx-4-54]|uniref:hypothetical protein n=1 Tax=Amycolatopsis sp. cmx-4-54 TaxID=2790936 RepID=UPI00397D7591
MGRHRLSSSPIDVVLSLWAHVLIAVDDTLTAITRRHSGTFRCDHCDVSCTYTNVSRRELRDGRAFAADHSRHRLALPA